MPDGVGIRLRCLPDGAFQQAAEIGWNHRILELDVTGCQLPQRALLEVESESMLYFGELVRNDGSTASVSVEHSLDRSRLEPIRETWG